MIRFLEPTEEHLLLLHADARPEEQAEVWMSNISTVYEAAKQSVISSIDVYTVMDDDKVLAITGLVPYTTIDDTASPWLLTTIHNKNNPRHLLRHTKYFIDIWSVNWNLENYIDARYEASVRWAKWAGFNVDEARPYGPFEMPFHRIWIERI